jgi:hypothetical protein
MGIGGLGEAWRQRPEGIRSLENWLVCWILLPNLGYWLLWIIGGPPRFEAVAATGFVGILTHRARFGIKFAAFVAAMALSALFFICALFNLSPLSLLDSLRFAGELRAAASVEYVVCAAAVVATLAAAWRFLRRPTALVQPTRIGFAAAVTLLAASADSAMSRSGHGAYGRTPDPSAPFTSAVELSGADRLATGERHLLVVMVEAMGQPVDPSLRRRLVDLWAPAPVRRRYAVTTGETLFYGSTTAAEIRELCGRWGDYQPLRETSDAACLPARLARRGYGTQAWHSFSGSFFDRSSWYPKVGFQKLLFSREIRAAGAATCPGVFPGACDRDVPRQIAAALKRAEKPQFLYWLTVNTHLPVLKDSNLGTDRCDRFDARLDARLPMTCRLFQLYSETGRALSAEILAEDFPATDILIVGDHMPPFFERTNRDGFMPDRVPWILLRPKKETPVRGALALRTPVHG